MQACTQKHSHTQSHSHSRVTGDVERRVMQICAARPSPSTCTSPSTGMCEYQQVKEVVPAWAIELCAPR